jgi:hypothetical protein
VFQPLAANKLCEHASGKPPPPPQYNLSDREDCPDFRYEYLGSLIHTLLCITGGWEEISISKSVVVV